MANKNPDMSKLEPFTPEEARKAARKSALKRQPPEPTVPVGIRIFARQQKKMREMKVSPSKLIRNLLDRHFEEKAR